MESKFDGRDVRVFFSWVGEKPPTSRADSWRDFCLFEIGPIWNDVLSGQLTLSHRIHGAGTLTYIQLICMVNVGKQTIHGFYG